jgi:WD40 repeat protein
VPLVATGVGALLVGGLLGQLAGRPTESAGSSRVVRSTIELEPGLALEGFAGMSVAVSPDGRTVAYVGVGEDGQHVYLRRLGESGAVRIEDSETGEGLFFSPDGRWLAFATGVTGLEIDTPRRLWKVPVGGGSRRAIATIEDSFGSSWGDDGDTVFVDVWGQGLWRVSADGGTPEKVQLNAEAGDPPRWLMWPRHVPGTNLLLVSDYGDPADGDGRLLVVDLGSGRVRDLGLPGTTALARDGRLLVSGYDGSLRLAEWDPGSGRGPAAPRRLIDDASVSGVGAALFAASAEGTLVYSRGPLGSGVGLSHVVRVDPRGTTETLEAMPDGSHIDLSLSPDGRRLAVASMAEGIWVWISSAEPVTVSVTPRRSGATACAGRPTGLLSSTRPSAAAPPSTSRRPTEPSPREPSPTATTSGPAPLPRRPAALLPLLPGRRHGLRPLAGGARPVGSLQRRATHRLGAGTADGTDPVSPGGLAGLHDHRVGGGPGGSAILAGTGPTRRGLRRRRR